MKDAIPPQGLVHLSTDTRSSQGRHSPRSPLRHVHRTRADLDTTRRRRTLKQEVVDIRVQGRLLGTRESTVTMAPDKREAHIVRHPVRLVNQAPGLHGPRRGNRSQPVNVVLEDEQPARDDEPGQEVVVLGDGRGRRDVAVEAWGEPGVLTYDFTGCLDVGACGMLGVGDAPGLYLDVSRNSR